MSEDERICESFRQRVARLACALRERPVVAGAQQPTWRSVRCGTRLDEYEGDVLWNRLLEGVGHVGPCVHGAARGSESTSRARWCAFDGDTGAVPARCATGC